MTVDNCGTKLLLAVAALDDDAALLMRIDVLATDLLATFRAVNEDILERFRICSGK